MEFSFDSVLQTGATGVVCLLLHWSITRGIPNIVKEFREEMEAVRAEHKEETKILREEQSIERQMFREALDRIVKFSERHDA